MKLIHCADLHLDSKLNANLDRERRKERKGELLHTFGRMVDYAAEHGVAAILIAGDLFDVKNISATANTVLHHINEHSDIHFYYLKGNHDNDNFLSGIENLPENLKLFNKQWKTYEEAGGAIAISGIELSPENAGSAYVSLVLDASRFQIVMLHGQENESAIRDNAEIKKNSWMPEESTAIRDVSRAGDSTNAANTVLSFSMWTRTQENTPTNLCHLQREPYML